MLYIMRTLQLTLLSYSPAAFPAVGAPGGCGAECVSTPGWRRVILEVQGAFSRFSGF